MRNSQRWIHALLLSTGCLAAVPVTCHSILEKRTVAADDDDYEWVTVSGSNMRKRVKKGSAPENDTASPVQAMSPQALEQMRQRAQQVHLPGS